MGDDSMAGDTPRRCSRLVKIAGMGLGLSWDRHFAQHYIYGEVCNVLVARLTRILIPESTVAAQGFPAPIACFRAAPLLTTRCPEQDTRTIVTRALWDGAHLPTGRRAARLSPHRPCSSCSVVLRSTSCARLPCASAQLSHTLLHSCCRVLVRVRACPRVRCPTCWSSFEASLHRRPGKRAAQHGH